MIKRFLHNVLGWGFPVKKIGPGGFQQNYSCQFCDREITQDSTRAWFHLTKLGKE